MSRSLAFPHTTHSLDLRYSLFPLLVFQLRLATGRCTSRFVQDTLRSYLGSARYLRRLHLKHIDALDQTMTRSRVRFVPLWREVDSPEITCF